MSVRHWDSEAEVVVVGYGGAGAVTAIAAHDAGAKVVVLEKQPADTPTETRHTPSTRVSGGSWLCPNDADRALMYFEGLARIANEAVDAQHKEMLRVFAERLTENTEWMKSIGVVLGGMESVSPVLRAQMQGQEHSLDKGLAHPEFPDLPGSEQGVGFFPRTEGKLRQGAMFFKVLSDAVRERGIEVLWDAPAEHLVYEGGEVRGVTARCQGRTISVKASRAVVLTCGGFEYNDWMKQNYLRSNPTYFWGSPAATGDGINMVLEVGANLWHMNCWSARAVMKFPEIEMAFGTQRHEVAGILVDKRGVRFTNERFKLHGLGYELCNYDCYAQCYPRSPIYWIFDEKRRTLAPLASPHGPCNPPGGVMGPHFYTWSEDNKVEIDREWIMKASTLEGLADRIKAGQDNCGLMNTSNLVAAVKRYNQLCHAGDDADFHRPAWTLAPLEDPPYYAVRLWQGGINTQGGPKRNVRSQVLRPDGSPLPRLYAGGEFGSIWGMFYQGGGNLGENIAFGRIAGATAAAEKRWG